MSRLGFHRTVCVLFWVWGAPWRYLRGRWRAVGAASPLPGYDAFVSYSHAADGRLAPALQAGLQSLAKPWYRRRALRVFRDKTSLSASPELWPAIERALAQARYFVLLASPEAARSPWVEREVRWWRAHRGGDTVLVVLTDGELVWDESVGDFDAHGTNAIPRGLRGWFAAEPLWVDLRWARDERHVSLRNPGFRDAVADLAAPLRGLPKDELVGEDIRQHRRVRRLARGAVALLTLLAVLASSAAVVAVAQRNEARNQARIATSRLLAATSQNLAGTHLDVARLLAVRAYRMDPNPQTRAALFQAVTASPFLVRYLKAGEPISVVSAAANGKVAVAGTQRGGVLRWEVRTGARTEVARLKGQITSLGTSADGSTITAADGPTVVVWTAQGKARSLQLPAGQEANLVAVSPSGRFISVYREVSGADGGSAGSGVVTLLDQLTQRSLDVRVDAGWTDQALPSETETVFFSQSGRWQRLSLPDLAKMGEGRINVGAHNYVNAISPSGRFVSFNNAGDAVMLWRTDKSGEAPYDAELTGRTPGGNPQALALSWDGKRTAIADTGTIYVSDTVPGPKPAGTPLALTGNDQVNGDVVTGGGGALRFFGDNDHLLSASGDALVVWDLTQHSLISRRMGVTVGWACNACPGPQVSVSPDGQKAGVVDGNNVSATVRQLERHGWETVIKGDFLGATNRSLLWSPDGSKLLVEVAAEGGGPVFDVRSASRPAALLGRWGPSPEPKEPAGVPALSGDARHVVTVGVDGAKTVIRNAATGAVERVVPALSGVKDAKIEHGGAVNADATALALLDYHYGTNLDAANLAKLVSLKDGRSRTIGSGPAAAALFSGEQLLVQRSSGVLELWDASGTRLQRSIAGEPGYVTGPVANRQGTLVARERSDGTVAITDLQSGEPLGSFRLPAARKAGMAFGGDGHTLVTVTEPAAEGKGELQRWTLSEAAWVHAACGSAGRDLTAAEWRRYAGSTPPGDLRCG
jgi:WD40 repeat protein